MRKIIFILFLALSSLVFGQDTNQLVLFTGSDWCNNCLKLKKVVLDKPEVKKVIDEHFELVIADFPRDESKLTKQEIKKNEQLADKYNHSGVFPTVVIIRKGELVAKKEGYRGELPKEFINWLNQSIK